MLQNYREVWTSLFATMMITTYFLPPSASSYQRAGVVDAGGVLHAMEMARGGLGSGNWSAPASAGDSKIANIAGRPIMVANVHPPKADAFQRLAAKAITINDFGPEPSHNTRILGLTKGDEELVFYQIKAESGAAVHYYNLAKDDSGRLLLFSRINGVLYIFALDAQQRPIGAAIIYPGQKASPVTIDSVRPQLHQMLGFWVEWASQNTSVAQG